MNLQNPNKTLKLVLSVGDESGIGPEIILKALCSNQIPKNIDYILVGSKKNLHNTYKCCLLYTSPSPRDISGSRMPSSA